MQESNAAASTQAFRFAPATPSDLERLIALKVLVMRESLERIGRFEDARARRKFADAFRPESMRLIFCDDRFAGCVALRPDGPGLFHIELFYLHPDHQGRGLGAAVMRRLLGETEGARIKLTVVRESDANRFYERFGFVEIGRNEMDVFYERLASTR